MRFTATRVQQLALLFSVTIHIAGAGLVLFMQPDSRRAGEGAPRQTLQVKLQQVQTELQRATAEISPAPDGQDNTKRDASNSMPQDLPRAVPAATANETPAVVHGQLSSRPVSMPKRLQMTPHKTEKKSLTESVQREKAVAASPVWAEEAAKAALSEADRVDYFSRLQAHIEAYKYYPRRARKQGIEGDVEVSFRLLENGEIDEIFSTGGHRLLNHAALRAVRDALPLPLPPAGLALPVHVKFSMRYELVL